MRILMLTSRMTIGGAESHILTLARELSAKGNRVLVASAGGKMADALLRDGIGHVTLPLDSKSILSLSLSYKGLCSLVDKFRPELIHSHSRITSMLVERYKTAHGSDIPFVTTAHMPFSTYPPYKQLSEWGERCIAVSEDIKKYLIDSYSLRQESIHVIKNGVAPSPDKDSARVRRALVRGALGIGSEAMVYISTSRSSESRAALSMYMCQHSDRILKDNEYLLLCVSGAVGRERDLTRELKKSAAAANRALGRRAVIILEGAEDVSAYLCAADVFIGVSRAAMEAMAHSLPVIIAGNEGVGGIFCLKNALILDHGNLTARETRGTLEDIPRYIEALRDDTYRAAIGEFCRKYASEHFSSEDMASRTLEVYKKATRPKLLLVGYYGAHNTGDEAALDILRQRLGGDYEIYYTAKHRTDGDEYAIPQTDIKRLSRIIRDSRAVIFGPGNLLQDRTSVRSISYYYAIFKEAQRQGRAVAFFSAGVGPLEHKISEKMAADMLTHAEFISAREPSSLYMMQLLTGREDIRIGADTVLLCKRARRSEGIRPGPRGYYVICPRADAPRGDVSSLGCFISEAKKMGLYPVLVAMDRLRDRGVCLTLAQGKYTTIEDIDAPTLYGLMSGARFCICSRLHGAVISALARVPFVAVDGDGRLGAFCIYTRQGSRVNSGSTECAELWAALDRAYKALEDGSELTDKLRDRAEEDIAALGEFLKRKVNGSKTR